MRGLQCQRSWGSAGSGLPAPGPASCPVPSPAGRAAFPGWRCSRSWRHPGGGRAALACHGATCGFRCPAVQPGLEQCPWSVGAGLQRSVRAGDRVSDKAADWSSAGLVAVSWRWWCRKGRPWLSFIESFLHEWMGGRAALAWCPLDGAGNIRRDRTKRMHSLPKKWRSPVLPGDQAVRSKKKPPKAAFDERGSPLT